MGLTVYDTTNMKPGETPRQWRVACMKAKLILHRNSGATLSDEELGKGLHTNADEIEEARETA